MNSKLLVLLAVATAAVSFVDAGTEANSPVCQFCIAEVGKFKSMLAAGDSDVRFASVLERNLEVPVFRQQLRMHWITTVWRWAVN